MKPVASFTLAACILLTACTQPQTPEATNAEPPAQAATPISEPTTEPTAGVAQFPESCDGLMADTQAAYREQMKASCLGGKTLQARMDNPDCLTHRVIQSCETRKITQTKY